MPGKEEKKERTFWQTRVGRLLARLFGYRARKGKNYVTNVALSDDNSYEDEIATYGRRHKPERLQVLCRTTKFTYKELQIIYRGFKNECPNGVVTEETLKQIYSQFFPHGDCSSYAHYVFRTFDTDNSGMIIFEDFVMGMSLLVRGSVEEKLRWTFSLYDLNGDGFVTRDELQDVVAAVHSMVGKYAEPPADRCAIRRHCEFVFNKLDANRNGAISAEDFVEICKQDERIHSSISVFDTIL